MFHSDWIASNGRLNRRFIYFRIHERLIRHKITWFTICAPDWLNTSKLSSSFIDFDLHNAYVMNVILHQQPSRLVVQLYKYYGLTGVTLFLLNRHMKTKQLQWEIPNQLERGGEEEMDVRYYSNMWEHCVFNPFVWWKTEKKSCGEEKIYFSGEVWYSYSNWKGNDKGGGGGDSFPSMFWVS